MAESSVEKENFTDPKEITIEYFNRLMAEDINGMLKLVNPREVSTRKRKRNVVYSIHYLKEIWERKGGGLESIDFLDLKKKGSYTSVKLTLNLKNGSTLEWNQSVYSKKGKMYISFKDF